MVEISGVMTIYELSDSLRISRSTLHKLAQKGRVPCRKVGRYRRFRKEANDHWLGPAGMDGVKPEGDGA